MSVQQNVLHKLGNKLAYTTISYPYIKLIYILWLAWEVITCYDQQTYQMSRFNPNINY